MTKWLSTSWNFTVILYLILKFLFYFGNWRASMDVQYLWMMMWHGGEKQYWNSTCYNAVPFILGGETIWKQKGTWIEFGSVNRKVTINVYEYYASLTCRLSQARKETLGVFPTLHTKQCCSHIPQLDYRFSTAIYNHRTNWWTIKL